MVEPESDAGDPIPGAADPLDRMPLRFIVGTTATGKTALALELAPRLGAEIIALDSMTVYRGLDIGTAKPTSEEQARVRHHLIDVADPAQRYDLKQFLADVHAAVDDMATRGKTPLFVGGTGLYLAALLRGLFEGPPTDLALRAELEGRAERDGNAALHAELTEVDPVAAERIHVNDTRRIVRALEVWTQTGSTLSSVQEQWGSEPSARERRAAIVGLQIPTDELDERIARRTAAMLAAGWPEEAERAAVGAGLGASAAQALGYDTALACARAEITLEEAQARIALRTRQFARRQRTWFRKFDIRWFDPRDASTVTAAEAVLRDA